MRRARQVVPVKPRAWDGGDGGARQAENQEPGVRSEPRAGLVFEELGLCRYFASFLRRSKAPKATSPVPISAIVAGSGVALINP